MKRSIKNYKLLTTFLRRLDTIVFFAITCTSVIFSVTGFGLKVIPKSTVVACALQNSNQVNIEIIMQKDNKQKKHHQRSQQSMEKNHKLYNHFLQDSMIKNYI